MSNCPDFYLGVDVGSTTVKVTLLDSTTLESKFHSYQRHNAEQAHTALKLLEEIHEKFPEANILPIFCGSGALEITRILDAFYVQEVVATGLIVKSFYPEVRTAIELGGQDAKLVFFEKDRVSGSTIVNDMRMNGSCAGGTGAFIDQIAELLNLSAEEFGQYAGRAENTYEISGRCGVFAKTDIQPLLNQGASKEDLAYSAFHAIAKQTIGGLAQGLDITGPVIFVGGPLTFNPTLIDVFVERLKLKPEEILIPDNPELFIARGAALAGREMFGDKLSAYTPENLSKLREFINRGESKSATGEALLFESEQELKEFKEQYALPKFTPFFERIKSEVTPGDELKKLPVYIGIDGGSTTSKFVMISSEGELLDKFYSSNRGEPLKVVRQGLLELRDRYRELGYELEVLGAGSTGYGERIFYEAFLLDYSTVETMAHTRAALELTPEVSFILDIGGQDMKAIYVRDGIPYNFELNEACSAGCGSFLETYAAALNISAYEIADIAFKSKKPSRLGSRCTVFMNSSIITEQKNGRSLSDIMSGLCYSVIENALTKVLRLSNYDVLGEQIVVQGGTFKNDAVLRAFQKKTGKQVIRPDHPGEMGAIGVAQLTREELERKRENGQVNSRFSWEWVENFTYKKIPASVCRFCSNNCARSAISFSGAKIFVTGNRCEKGEILEDTPDAAAKERLRAISKKMSKVTDLMSMREKLIQQNFDYTRIDDEKGISIGLPLILEFWNSLPFWSTVFRALGFDVVISSVSNAQIFESGLASVSSDTICLPAKVAHGHIKELIEKKPDRIFNPMMMKLLKENKNSASTWTCPVVQGYSEVIRISDEPSKKHGIAYDAPPFLWDTYRMRNTQIANYMKKEFGIAKKKSIAAIEQGHRSMFTFKTKLEEEGQRLLDSLTEPEDFAVIIAGRPYHNDSYINHNLSSHFTGLGIPVLELDSVPGLSDVDLSDLFIETNNNFHTRLLAAAIMVASRPQLELVQIVSFGCGHDAVLSDEVTRLMKEPHGKMPLILKLDEGENVGPIGIRVRSFIETVRNKRRQQEKILNCQLSI